MFSFAVVQFCICNWRSFWGRNVLQSEQVYHVYYAQESLPLLPWIYALTKDANCSVKSAILPLLNKAQCVYRDRWRHWLVNEFDCETFAESLCLDRGRPKCLVTPFAACWVIPLSANNLLSVFPLRRIRYRIARSETGLIRRTFGWTALGLSSPLCYSWSCVLLSGDHAFGGS